MRLIPIDVNTPQEKLAEDIAHALDDAGLVGSLEAMPVAIKVMGMCQRFLDDSAKPVIMKCKTEELFGADPNCDHEVIAQPGGGIKCTKCPGWFCF
jgi:hypothetical protein